LRLVEKLLLVWVHTVLDGHWLEFVDHLGLPDHLKLLLLQRLLSADDLLAHVQLLWDLLHRLVQDHIVLLHLLLLRHLIHLLLARLEFRRVSLGVKILFLEHHLVQINVDIAIVVELLLVLRLAELP